MKNVRGVDFFALIPILIGPECNTQSFKVSCLFRDENIGKILLQKVHGDLVAGDSAYHGDFAPGNMLMYFDDLGAHHLTQSSNDITKRLSVIKGMGAVAFAEDRTPSGDLKRLMVHPQAQGLLGTNIHPANLLQKKLPCA